MMSAWAILCAAVLTALPVTAQLRPPVERVRLPRFGPERAPAGPTPEPQPIASPQRDDDPAAEPPTAADPPPAAERPLSKLAAARALRKRIKKLLRRSPLRGVKVAVVVTDTATGEDWVRINADRPMNPASNIKLVTSAVALDRLGPNHRFSTQVLAKGDTVFLRGNGDPMLLYEHLKGLVKRSSGKLKSMGPFSRVVVDANAFRGGVLPPGFAKKKTDASYRAAVGAVALDWGTARVEVWPTREGKRPRVVVTPGGGYVKVDNQARTVVGRGTTIRIRLKTRGDRSVAIVTGKIGRNRRAPSYVKRRIEHPPLAAGYAFKRLLGQAGVTVDGPVRLADTARGATTLATHRSAPSIESLSAMNKLSNNFIAEMYLRGLVNRRPATWSAGRKLVSNWLKQTVGIQGFEYNNGSGLYDGGRFSARHLVELLLTMNKHKHRAAYRDTLATAGLNGTLRGRLKGDAYRGRVIGKTGTLNDVSALSGYARNRKRRLLAFSILMNDTRKATPAMRSIQDRVAALLVDSR